MSASSALTAATCFERRSGRHATESIAWVLTMSDNPDLADDLRALVDEWREIAEDLKTEDDDYSAGMEEGARSAAQNLERLIERHSVALSDESMECHGCGREHADWEHDGEHTVDGEYHAGRIKNWKCGECGAITEIPTP